MLRFMEGFDQFRGSADDALKGYLTGANYTPAGALTLAAARDNTQVCLQIGDGAATVSSLKRTFISTAQKAVIGFAYNAAVRTDIVAITSLGTLSWSATTGKITFAGATGTAIILVGLWYYFEIVVDKANGIVQLWINNGKDIEAPLPSSAQFLTTYETTWVGTGDKKLLDDIAFLDNNEGKYVDRIGPISIMTRLPTSDVNKEWSPSNGNDHFALVDNQPPIEGEYVQSNTSGAYDTFLSNTGLPQGAQVIAVGVTVLNRKSDIDNRQLGILVGQKGQATKEVVDTALTTTPKYSYAVFESAPNDAAWTSENTTSVPFGVVVRP